jgi:DNA repair photolyase
MGVPVGVNPDPIIPSLNNHEILALMKLASLDGVIWASYTVEILNISFDDIFSD